MTTRPRYILIDDDDTYRAILSRYAKNEGMELEAYASLTELGSVGLLGRYDVAIVDYQLEELTGVEIGEYLSALFGNIPMVLISENQREPDAKGWPISIKKFVKKSRGYAYALNEARKCAKDDKHSVVPQL